MSLEKKKRRRIIRVLVASQISLFIVVLAIALLTQNIATDKAVQETTVGGMPQVGAAALVNITYPSLSLGALQENYNISTDGRYIYAQAGNRLVYGGPESIGGANGTNAASVINMAIASLKDTGGLISIQKGEYTLSGVINMASKVDLAGESSARFVLGYNGTMFEFASATDSALVNCELDGSSQSYAGNPIVVKDGPDGGSSRNIITGNHIVNCGNRGVIVETSKGAFNNISFNRIMNAAREGIMLSRSNYNLVYGNIVNMTGCHGIISTGGSYNNITANLIENAGGNYVSGFAHGIAVDGNHGLNTCYGNVVSGNVIKNVYMVGIEVADGTHKIKIENNSITNTRGSGIFFGGAFAVSCSAIISGNNLYRCGMQGDQGILVSGVSAENRTWDVAVTENVVDSAGVDGIRIKWVTESNVTGNDCHKCGGYGIAFEDSNTDCILITNNNLRVNALGSLNLHRVDVEKISLTYSNPFFTNVLVSSKYIASRQTHNM